MTLNELFKNTTYDDTLFSDEAKSAVSARIFMKACISQIDDFPQTQENAVFEYAEKHKAECFDQLADYVEILDFPEMTLSNWKIEKGRIALKGWFSAMLKLQQRNAEAIENGAGSITTECKGFDFSITLGDDFKIATDKETQKEIIEIKLQGS